MAVDSVHCSGCQARLEEDPHAPRQPCPHCGSLIRRFGVTASDTAVCHSKVNLKGRHAGGVRPFVEQAHGSDLHRQSGRWMRLDRVVDREKNRYTERVTDPATGEVVHECAEPLTDHQDHGAAKGHPKRTDG
jgi:predicted RNA-binding Zn-ribbon protein involved in translation (DUF1610 family)